MEIRTLRFANTKKSCKSLVFINGEFFCFALEDPVRKKKVPKVTAIPKGKYVIKFRETPSPLTSKYREKFDFFSWHLHINRVPGYQFVYLHIGNYPGDSDGCLLLNNIATANADHMGESTTTFRAFYLKVKSALEKGETVTIDIREDRYLKPLLDEESGE